MLRSPGRRQTRGAASRRPVQAATPATAKRAEKGATKKGQQLAELLLDPAVATDAPMSARSLLAAGLHQALVFPDATKQLHELQLKVLKLVIEVLGEMVSKTQEEIPALQKAYEVQLVDYEGAAVLHTLAVADLEEAEDAVEALTTKLKEAQDAAKEATASDAAARKAWKAAEKHKETSEKDTIQLTAFESDIWKVLVSGATDEWSEQQVHTAVSKAVKEFVKLGAEQTLVACFDGVLSKKPEDRKGFDAQVLEAAEAFLAEKLSTSKEVSEELTAKQQEFTEQLEEAETKLKAAIADRDDLQKRLLDAQAKLEACKTAKVETEKAESALKLEVDGRKAEADAASERETSLEEAISYLKEVMEPPEHEAEEPAAESAVAEEEAAAASAAE
eukprot:CAMPEP_0178410528 /NCGR_PEP_ID=MMETSP0689_2-20121128/21025_1 /TAXON_ID=160604 /ORGANISM="Amphidinium massartii, Strain CS-259" /LENGTH=389 /DNA_ID=CAMNT_0020031705 /DNA_START=1 /DNA_END=1170 /DNA_ORIENTATION=-